MRRSPGVVCLSLGVLIGSACAREAPSEAEAVAPVPEAPPPAPPPLPGPPPPAPEVQGALAWTHETPDGYDSDVYRWLDSAGRPRVAVLTRNDMRDPGGSHGGMLRRYRFPVGAGERVATGTGAHGLWNGWGYVVSHADDGAAVSHSAGLPGAWRHVFLGANHAVHEFSWTLPLAGVPVHVTAHWFFATGRDHPVFAVTFDSSAAGSGGLRINADSRTPYGDIAWDGDGTQAWVDGVRWGDRYRFASRTEPLTAASDWDYSQPNTVPFVSVYSRAADAEMGMVQTLDWVQHNTGGSWFHDNWGRTAATRAHGDLFRDWRMPPDWNWPYQVCQYEMDSFHPTRSKRLAWGLMYGAVGKTAYSGYGLDRVLTGHPYQSYSLFVVLGAWSLEPVRAQGVEVEHALQARLRVVRGAEVSEGPGGVARADSVRYAVSGYNSVYGVHELRADAAGGFAVELDAAGGALLHPVFLIQGARGPPRGVTLDGEPLQAGVDYFASFDASTGALWLTVSRRWQGRHLLADAWGE
ncbi:hypothetical protein [Melittangium boletus]|uniref:hypothetical protein n=1 Tax=Melittangium boletus TaxID=83453 RepID=UPI003DA2DFDD